MTLGMDDVGGDAAGSARSRLRSELFNPLTVIMARTELLQRIVQQTPGLTELERTAISTSLADTMAAANALRAHLEPLVDQVAPPDGDPNTRESAPQQRRQ